MRLRNLRARLSDLLGWLMIAAFLVGIPVLLVLISDGAVFSSGGGFDHLRAR